MSPEVLARKLVQLRRFLEALRRYEGATADELERDPFAVERLLVHMYDQIDYRVLAGSIAHALEDFGVVLEVFEKRLAAMEE